MMKERLIVWTIASLLPIAIIAGNIDVSSTGPSGQGDLVYKARATGVTNLAMGTGGLYNVTLDPRYPITGAMLPGNLTLANTYMIVGNASGVGAATTPAAVRTNLSLVIGADVQAYDADLDTLALNNGGSLTNLQAATALVGIVPAANGGAGASSGILKANGAGLVSAASSTTDYVAPITQVASVTTNALVATVKFQSSIAGVQHLTGWLSEAAGGAAVGTNAVSIVGADSTTVLAGGGAGVAYAVWTSKSDGLSTLTVTIDNEQAGLYFNTVQHNGVVVSTPAFDVAP